MPLRAILFDLFDTLVDLYMERLPEVELDGRRVRYTTAALHAEVIRRADVPFETFARALAAVDRELGAPRTAQGRELPTLERFTVLAGRLGISDPSLPEALTLVHMGRIRELAQALPHHVDVLRTLRQSYRLAVCSNFSHAPTANAILEQAGLTPSFDFVGISEDVGFRKPRPEIFRACLDALGVAPEETLHVGDRLAEDVLGARKSGLRTCWITRRVADPARALAEHTGAPPDAVISDLDQLPGRLRELVW
jgi:HAD superfamily hydrolase (TIGR01549 family)